MVFSDQNLHLIIIYIEVAYQVLSKLIINYVMWFFTAHVTIPIPNPFNEEIGYKVIR
jgi:hypothetical protein